MFFARTGRLAVAQFVGSHQTTLSCLTAVARLLIAAVPVSRALLLSAEGRHCFYLECDDPEPIFVRGGFTSGYPGEGAAGLAIALHLFHRFQIDVEEIVLSSGVLNRIDENRPTFDDVKLILSSPVVRPTRVWDYKHEGLRGRGSAVEQMRALFVPTVPWLLIDERLLDLALILDRDPDKAVFEAFRRLESLVAKRAGLPRGVVGLEVFRRTFRGSGAKLVWRGLPAAEVEGRAQLFEAAFLAYRNPRAHREEDHDVSKAYREFYLVNELFRLEDEAEEVERSELSP